MCVIIFSQLIYTVCERLLELAKKGSSLRRHIEKDSKVKPTTNLKTTFSNVSQSSEKCDSSTNVNKSSSKDSIVNNKKRYKRSLAAVRGRYKSISLEDLADDKFKSVIDASEKASISSSNSGFMSKTSCASDEEEDDDDSIVYGNSTVDLKSSVCSTSKLRDADLKLNGKMNSTLSENSSITGTEDWSIDQSVMTVDMSEAHVQAVGYALSTSKIESYVRGRATQLEVSSF